MGKIIPVREDGTAWNRQLYEWKSASVTVDEAADPQTNLNTITGFTALFGTVKRAQHIRIETSGTAYIRLNENDNDVITIGATTPYEDDFGVTEAIFISTANVARTITVKLS